MSQIISPARALIERAIKQGEAAPLFTPHQLALIIPYLDKLYAESPKGKGHTDDIKLTHRLPDHLRIQVADEMRRVGDLEEARAVSRRKEIARRRRELEERKQRLLNGRGRRRTKSGGERV